MSMPMGVVIQTSLHFSDSSLNPNFSVHTVLVVQVNVVSLQTLERGFTRTSDMLW